MRYRNPVFAEEELGAKLARASGAGLQALTTIACANAEAHGPSALEERVPEALERLGGRTRRKGTLLAATVHALAADSIERAISFGERYIEEIDHPDANKILAQYHARAGAIHRPIELLSRNPQRRQYPKLEKLRVEARLLEEGLEIGRSIRRTWRPANNRRILYFVSQSLPHHSAGYAIRTHWLLRHLVAREWEIAAFARFGYPNDRSDFRDRAVVGDSAEVDGISYTFVPDREGFRHLDVESYHAQAVSALVKQAGRYRPALIHAASNYLVGLSGTAAARKLGLPSIYEMRGLWHMTRASREPEYDDSDHYRMSQRLEVQAARNADHVFAITKAVRDLLVGEGVKPERVTLLPNAVDPEQFSPRNRDMELGAELGVGDEVVIGFIGSFPGYEGLDYLLEAAASMKAQLGDVFKVLLVGGGAAYDDLVAQSKRMKIDDRVIFTGRVSHQRVPDYYSLIDIAAFPRKGVRVCEVVSPLKPFEAMAMQKCVVASDVQALAEMVQHEETGLLHRKDDVESLADQLTRLIRSPELRRELAQRGRDWVTANRSWSQIAQTVEAVYADLLKP